MSDTIHNTTEARVREHVPLVLEPCDKAHDAEQDRLEDEDQACDDGVN